MSTTAFKEDSLGWQLRLLTQRGGEWWELKTSQLTERIPEVPALESEWIWQIIKLILWSIIAVLLVWITWQVWLLVRPYLKNLRRRKTAQIEVKQTQAREELSVKDWIARSQQLVQQGDYRQAIFCLYEAMLQKLDEGGIIPQLASRTDGEYLELIQQLQPSQSQSYRSLLLIHQRLCFSRTEASISLWEQSKQIYQEIESEN
jgi:hypothetical protein